VLEYVDIVAAISWLTNTFGFSERWRVGNHRAQLSFEDGAIVISEANPDKPIHRSTILVRVRNVSAHCEHAQKQGADILRPSSNFPYGERQYSVRDIGGHLWTFSQTIADVTPEEWGGVSVNL